MPQALSVKQAFGAFAARLTELGLAVRGVGETGVGRLPGRLDRPGSTRRR